MLGAIVGDFIGSPWEGGDPFEFRGALLRPSCGFTDDTVLTITTAYAWAVGEDVRAKYRESILDYWSLGFSEALLKWAEGQDEQQHFNVGNGAAIRVSPVVLFANSLHEALDLAATSASATHYHEHAIQLATVVGGATYLAHRGHSPAAILQFARVQSPLLYRRPRSGQAYHWESVVTAIEIACQTDSFESCMCECVAAGGDVDSVCAMAGGLSEGFWGIPSILLTPVLAELEKQYPDLFLMLKLAAMRGGQHLTSTT
ncbi:ADP-ribosylglycohydrolase family protein [Marinobacter sp. F4216]|uniref:ADP-ribosylglycohydrolase family protein n=1 Tax=Marinobacter sp. F4216 TaxID=2874281 RepID=UPI001CBB4A79|nr:ADP-ribosylglycohydrolase family protein [Marinobacter sp. F4216]MBZ2170267.1 ADP-ribosylglycohydrolase family protein [Marinobacter sp. F4216]